jgi:hypothetical protein
MIFKWWMLTRFKLKRGEGSLEEANLDIGLIFRRREMVSPRGHPFGFEEVLFQSCMKIQSIVEEM